MCGILGGFKTRVQKEKFLGALGRLSHRGPDGEGVWQSDDHLCILGHRRLAILDLSDAGCQPMLSSDRKFCITFNGEIYNFVELRDKLKSRGYQFKSRSDTEVALYAYAEWGTECFAMFNGMWAMAIYSIADKSLVLSRDRFGVKPLYYAKKGEGYIFGSEMKALIPLMETTRVRESDLSDTERIMLYEYTSHSLINEIEKVQPGYYLKIDSWGGVKKTRWWNTLDCLMEIPDHYEEQCEIFRELFLDACRLRMRSDVTIGTALSGGLDSSATICAMSYIADGMPDKYLKRDFQNAFVAAFPNTTLDETFYAHAVTSYLNITESTTYIDPIKGLEQLPDLLYGFENVYYTSPVPMVQTYGAMREKGVYVTVDGHGADELFGGYPFDITYALLDAAPFTKNQMSIFESYNNMYPDDDSSLSLKNRMGYNAYARFLMHYCYRKIKGYSEDNTKYENAKVFKRLSHFNRKLYISAHFSVLPTLLRNYDLYSMMNGVEIRMPFLDYRIVRFAFSINWESKLRNGFTKSIIRDSLRDIMPREVTERKTKIGFNTPIVEWLKGPWREWVLDEIHSQEFATCMLIDHKSVSKQIEKVVDDSKATYSDAEIAWTKLMPYLWERYFYKRAIR